MESLPSGVYIVQNAHNHNWAIISNTNDYSEVVSGTDVGDDVGNKWLLKRLQNKTYTLQNDPLGYYATYRITDDFDRPVMSLMTSHPQQWHIKPCDGFYIIYDLDGVRCWTLRDDFLHTPIELEPYTRNNRQHWTILPDGQDDGTPRAVHVDTWRPVSSVAEDVPSRRVNDAPIYLLADNFMGRLNDLNFLSQAFCAPSEEDVPTRCAVHGMPGLGKTKLVLRFAQIMFAQFLYSHIFWVSAATTDKVIEGIAKILDLIGHPERTRSDQNAKLIAARLWLEDSQQINGVRWLLIVDNVDKSALEFLHEHLPRRNAKGNILFTTRASDVADSLVRIPGGRHSKLELRVPDLVETTHLLFSSSGIDATTVTPTQHSQAEQLVQNLGCLPLAVVQAASYMRQTDMTLDSMLQISKGERKIEVIEWESDLATDQQRSVVATFDNLFDQIERDFPKSYNVLGTLSFLDPEDIPLAMLVDGAKMSSTLVDQPPRSNSSDPADPTHALPELRTLVSLILSPTAFPKALHKLQSLSLVEPMSRDGERSLRMHELVHFMTREHVKRRTTYQTWLESVISLVCRALQCVEDPTLPRWWPVCEKFMPHVLSLSKVRAGVEGVNLELVTADVRLAEYLNSRGRYDDAERACRRGVGGFRKALGDTHKDALWAFYLIAQIYYNRGRITQAEEAFKHVLAVMNQVPGSDHHNTLATMHELARVYRRQGRYEEAEELFKRVLAAREKKLGPDHPRTLRTMHNLASVYNSRERYEEAVELFNLVLIREEKFLGFDHVDTLNTVHNLAIVYQAQTKYIDAEELFTRALLGWEKQIGLNHPQTLTAAMNLAHLYQLQGRNDDAERFYLRAFMGMKQQLGSNHPHTLLCANYFAALYRSQRRNNEADTLLGST